MIYTCTLNPSVDYFVMAENFHEGQLNRATKSQYYPGGKGINVSRILSRLHVENIALGFVGGFTGQFITEFLGRENVKHNFTEIDDVTRINVKIKSQIETELNGSGPTISSKKQHELLTNIQQLNEDDLLILAGSLPNSLPDNFYEQITNICQNRNVPFVVDTSGKSLEQLVKKKPFLIKPNHHELGELFNTSIQTVQDAVKYAEQLVEDGVENVIVSLGEKGAIFVNNFVQYKADVPQGEVKNTVGAGDSLLSGFISSYITNKNEKEAFQYGVATGSATAFNLDLCTKEDVENLLNHINITTIRG
ncbi:1-phosphofructokinase [Salirhabdus salicampi]|uniref:1-phosphofructokinase n=1 Tax=Salirhabdus salicampi TaxID=476102 RepID=UPI0020C45035|nr:1-phosphofructokinase [Salirhabdus salicampi]MCP8617659.1 1-phosphofructokinase [Salirhabdus salicampi]